MDALILSCSTGGGHNSAGIAVKEALEQNGNSVVMLDPYSLVGKNLDKKVGKCYVNVAQRTPHLFGAIYKLGDAYRRLPFRSPVYFVNKLMLKAMRKYLSEHKYDVILMPHVFPGEILTYMKNKGISLPKMIFIATDYTCIPFTEETKCDYYVIASSDLTQEYVRHGIEKNRLVSAGVPTKLDFNKKLSKTEAKKSLDLDVNVKYLLLSGGSIGAGMIDRAVSELIKFLNIHPDYKLITVCGNNQRLIDALDKKYGGADNIILLSSTDKFAYYLRACEVFISKPGGLSSTEAAVVGVPLVHIAPIPGCETLNMKYFSERNMSIAVGNNLSTLCQAVEKSLQVGFSNEMIKNQRQYINSDAARQICALAEKISQNQ